MRFALSLVTDALFAAPQALAHLSDAALKVTALLVLALALLTLAWKHAQLFDLQARASPAGPEQQQRAAAVAAKLGLLRAVPVRESAEVMVPMVCGVLRPVVLLPEASKRWPPERLDLV